LAPNISYGFVTYNVLAKPTAGAVLVLCDFAQNMCRGSGSVLSALLAATPERKHWPWGYSASYRMSLLPLILLPLFTFLAQRLRPPLYFGL
jgi:hypothetical protein